MTPTKLPPEIMPVVRILRREVEKPEKDDLILNGRCRWLEPRSHSRGCWDLCCPMGLAPKSKNGAPYTQEGFGYCVSELEVKSFANWWDRLNLDQAREAVDLIWPEKRRKKVAK